jgi:CRP-like cAMP-binding protein
LILENPEFASGIIETLNVDLAQSYKRMFSLMTKQVSGRFSELLLFMSNVLYQSNPFDLTISKRDLAGMISTSPENLSRLISEFKARGIINSSGQTIEILSVNELESLCNCDSLSTIRI